MTSLLLVAKERLLLCELFILNILSSVCKVFNREIACGPRLSLYRMNDFVFCIEFLN